LVTIYPPHPAPSVNMNAADITHDTVATIEKTPLIMQTSNRQPFNTGSLPYVSASHPAVKEPVSAPAIRLVDMKAVNADC
uniref:Capsid protein n=1 Tax=Haemonchus placei TaxID=6290 RepID=A0A0N4W9Q5_HAEPC